MLIRHALAGSLALAVGMGLGRFLYTALMPSMLDEGLLSVAQAAKLASVNYAGYLLGRVTLAGHEARGKAVRLSSLAFWLLAAALLLAAMSQARHYGAMLAVRALSGLAGAGIMVLAGRRVLGRIRHPAVSACVHGGVGLGIVLGNEFAVQARALLLWDTERVWLGTGALGFVLGVAILICLAWPEPKSPAAQPPSPRPARKLPLPHWGVPVAANALTGLCYAVSMTYIPLALAGQLAESPLRFHVWTLLGLAVIPSGFLWASARQKTGLLRSLAANLALQATGALLFAHGTVLPLQALGAACIGVTFMGRSVLALPLATVTPFPRSRNPGRVMFLAYGAGLVLGPLAVLATPGQANIAPALTLTAAGLLASAWALWTARGRVRRSG